MTEHRAPYITQSTLFGGTEPPQDLTPQEQVAYILEQNPAARNDDRELMLAYWVQFDGLTQVLGEEGAAWFRRLVSRGDASRDDSQTPRRDPEAGPWWRVDAAHAGGNCQAKGAGRGGTATE